MDYRNELGNWEEIILEPSGDTLPIGSIAQFGGETAPTNWLFCNGQAVSRETYSELFAVIGTTYGEGNGSTTFNLPDFSSRSPMGVGTGTDETNSETTTLGQEKGEYKHKLTVDEMPEHSHNIGKEGAILYGGNRAYFSSAGSIQTWTNNDAHSHTSTKGGSQAHNTVHPVLGINFIIKAKQSVGLVGNVVSDINATGDNDVAPTKVIKEYIDNKNTYSTDEIIVGTFLGKPLYRKTINIGSLPNNTTKNIAHNITNISQIVNLYGISYRTSDSRTFTLPYVDALNTTNGGVSLGCDATNIIITTAMDRASFNSSYITIEYTKTTN